MSKTRQTITACPTCGHAECPACGQPLQVEPAPAPLPTPQAWPIWQVPATGYLPPWWLYPTWVNTQLGTSTWTDPDGSQYTISHVGN